MIERKIQLTRLYDKEPGEALSSIYKATWDPKGQDTAWGHKLKNCPNIWIFKFI